MRLGFFFLEVLLEQNLVVCLVPRKLERGFCFCSSKTGILFILFSGSRDFVRIIVLFIFSTFGCFDFVHFIVLRKPGFSLCFCSSEAGILFMFNEKEIDT